MDTTEDQVIESEELEQPNGEAQEPQEEVQEDSQEENVAEEAEQPEEPQEEPAEEPVEEEKQPSRRESLRIKQLISKLDKQVSQQPTVPGENYRDILEADEQVYEQLETRQGVRDKAIYEEARQRQQADNFKLRLEFEAPRVESQYPVLDPRSDRFSPEVADALNTSYLSLVGYDEKNGTIKNPSIRYTEYIEAQMELANAIASDTTVKATKNIAKQAATTGLRPDGSKAKSLNLNKAPQDMTDEELAAVMKTIR